MCVAVACLNAGHPGRAFLTRQMTTETSIPLEAQVPK
jgi:hypothetical protein